MDPKDIITTVKMRSEGGKKVSKAKVLHIWNQLYPKERLPKISAGVVPKEDFFDFQNQIRGHYIKLGRPDYIETESIKEWGEVVEGCACAVKSTDGYLVLVRSDSPHSLEEDLKHELTHIHNGDCEPPEWR